MLCMASFASCPIQLRRFESRVSFISDFGVNVNVSVAFSKSACTLQPVVEPDVKCDHRRVGFHFERNAKRRWRADRRSCSQFHAAVGFSWRTVNEA